MATIRLLQANLNHSRGAQDLLVAKSWEWFIDIAVVAEPYRELPRGLASTCGGAAIAVLGDATTPLEFLGRGQGFVAASWGNLAIVSVYFPPSMDVPTLIRSLDEIGSLILGLRSARAPPRGAPPCRGEGAPHAKLA